MSFVSSGNFKGLISGVSIWDSALTGKEIMANYLHYQRILEQVNPVLTRKQARYYLPRSIHQCFPDKIYLASALKNRAGVVAHSCPAVPLIFGPMRQLGIGIPPPPPLIPDLDLGNDVQ